jgi:hypothetical protein
MKILHLYRHEPDAETKELVAIVSRDRVTAEFNLYQGPVDYDRLLELALSYDQVISWW